MGLNRAAVEKRVEPGSAGVTSRMNQAADGSPRLQATLDLAHARAELLWRDAAGAETAQARVDYDQDHFIHHFAIVWTLQRGGETETHRGGFDSSSIHAALRRWRKAHPAEDAVMMIDGEIVQNMDGWRELGTRIYHLFKPLRDPHIQTMRNAFARGELFEPEVNLERTPWRLVIELNMAHALIALRWHRRDDRSLAADVRVTVTGKDELTWTFQIEGSAGERRTSQQLQAISKELDRWLGLRPVSNADAHQEIVTFDSAKAREVRTKERPFSRDESIAGHVAEAIGQMARQLRQRFTPLGRIMSEMDGEARLERERHARKMQREAEKRAAQRAELENQMRVRAQARLERERAQARERIRYEREQAAAKTQESEVRSHKPAAPPPVSVRIELPPLQFQDTAFALNDLRGWLLRERAALWWVSNQSDDLLCLPHCRIERLDYQLRSALRVLGPLRGRALLSDEVGLGKTIEAGLVLKELFTRGMARRALVLTVPSLVDQWREELAEKFGLTAATTNDPSFRERPVDFWQSNAVIVASLHTLKQPAHLAVAREVAWDALIVDEAHHLRNRDSQAWQAVSVLPRQFLLLLTATPVQNSIEELYNLVTLLQPGQLPTPREFRARFIDPKRPREPREPDELRRLLGQVMIRNTRASAGINLPPRRAETALFDPEPEERAFWEEWESELRVKLTALPAGQAQLWGRLLLQAAGSSPAAWRDALEKFPDHRAVRTWRERAPLEASWRRKCALLPPLTRGEGGCVVFSQFRATQAALAAALAAADVPVVAVNGATPAATRQSLTEEFRRRGGALLLTRSGAEGRNLQFCHRLVNFDLPWNPMEIEQRIGRLHRLGQQHPVRIYNLVQRGTLQEHLLTILQEKLNLFELVIGETGLILGERFSSGEFAEEILHRWRESEGQVAESFASLGEEIAAARAGYAEVKRLDETLFAQDYESV